MLLIWLIWVNFLKTSRKFPKIDSVCWGSGRLHSAHCLTKRNMKNILKKGKYFKYKYFKHIKYKYFKYKYFKYFKYKYFKYKYFKYKYFFNISNTNILNILHTNISMKETFPFQACRGFHYPEISHSVVM